MPQSGSDGMADPNSAEALEEDTEINRGLIVDAALRQKIESLLEGRKSVTINDVARLSGLSKKTISRIINNAPNVRDETREYVNEIIRLTKFSPDPQARGLALRRSFLIGLIYDNPNAQYVVTMQMGILDKLRGTGNELVVHPCDRNSPDFISRVRDFIERQRLSGVIVLPPIAENRDLLAMIEELNLPMIRITARSGEHQAPPIRVPQIVSLDALGCCEASEHLVRLGHRRIGFIGGNLAYVSAHERRKGFEEGLRRHGLTLDPSLDVSGDYSFESGYAAAMQLLQRSDRPTAIISSNDEMSAGVYKAAYELNLSIPRDLSVVSFDDSPLAARLSPGLSTVRLPVRDIARQAAEAVLRPDPGHANYAFRSEFVVRNSTAPVRLIGL